MSRLLERLMQPYIAFDGEGGGGGGAPADNRVAEAQRKQREAEDRAREAERKQRDLESRLSSLEDANGTELERERKRADRAEAKLSELEGQIKQRDTNDRLRSTLARPAADGTPAPQPHDFDAMLRFVDTDAIKSDADAEKAIADLRESHAFLFREAAPAGGTPPPAAPAPFGVPANTGGAVPPPAVPTGPNGEPDVKAGVGAGLLQAIGQFRGQRQQQG